MCFSKVIFGDKTLIDLTADTVTPETLAEGVTAHDAAGNAITGTMAACGGGIVEVSIDAEMNDALTDDNVGSAYIFTGESGLYTNGDIYIVADGAPSFADASWEHVIIACQTNTVPETWSVGEQKTMTIGDADYTIDIIGKNHDVYSDGSGTAPLTFQFHDCYGTMFNHGTVNGNSSNTNGYFRGSMPFYLNSVRSSMPSVVQSAIKEVNKRASVGNQSMNVETAACSLFLLSENEIFGGQTHSVYGEGARYEYYTNGGGTVKSIDGTASPWWERSPDADMTTMFCCVSNSGTPTAYGSKYDYGIAPAFCF